MARVRASQTVPDGWTYRDEVLIATLVVVHEAVAGRLDSRPLLTSRFALEIEEERLVASGRYSLEWWGTVGDGRYSTQTIFVGGTGALGIGLAAGSLIGSHRANSRARSRAIADACPKWRAVDAGELHISDYGIYVTGGQYGHRYFHWGAIRQADVVEHGCVQYTAETTAGSQTFRLMSESAELVFAFWALARHRNHPQWIDGSWYPFDVMRARAAHFHRPMPARLTT